MNANEIFEFLYKNLKIRIQSDGTPNSCGGEVEGNLGLKVELLLYHPTTGELRQIDWDKCDLH